MLDRIISEIFQSLQTHTDKWAERSNPYLGYKRKENNIFSLASALFILQEINDFISEESQITLQKIKALIQKEYPRYRNKDGRATYNFYTTRPSGHFPNGWLMQYMDHFRLPDDIDDTALIALTTTQTKNEISDLKKLTENFAQIFPDGTTVYNTWYGKSMPKEQDVCTILNLFYLYYRYGMPLNKIDYDSFVFLRDKIDSITGEPFKIARHYANPALILYHYARFMSRFSSPLDQSKTGIINLIYKVLEKEPVFMNRLILETSLLKLGESRPPLLLKELTYQGFYTFIGAPLAPFSGKIIRKLSGLKITQMFWNSDIHNKALVAEYLVYAQKHPA